MAFAVSNPMKNHYSFSRIATITAFLLSVEMYAGYCDVMEMDTVDSSTAPARIEPGYPRDNKVIAENTEAKEKPFVFNENEWSADVFALYAFEASDGAYGDGFGPGLGINYFFSRFVGVGVEGYGWNGDGNITAISGNVILRYPMDELRLAPYLIGGVGGNFGADNVEDQVNGSAGLGLEYRIIKNWSVFTDARYVVTSESNDYGIARAGVRFSF
jgi:hypothetical protein